MKSHLFCLLFIPSLCSATGEFVPIQEKAQGQSLTGANLLNDSLYSNPASSSFTQVYSVEADYWMPRSFAASILDTRTSPIGGAMGYFRKNEGGVSEPLQGLRAALSNRVHPNVSLGIGGKILWGPNSQGQHINYKDFDMGALANFNVIQLGLNLRNIGGGEATLLQQREWALGGRVNYEQLLFLSTTAISKWGYVKPYQYGFGAEYVSPYFFSLKGGFRLRPQSELSYWSVGASILAPKIGIHYAVEIPNQGKKDPEHVIGANVIL